MLLCALAPASAQAEQAEFIDYVSQLDFNRGSETVKAEVTVKTFVDGDTVHFHVDEQIVESGVLKARFLAINTPECTGKIEEYGKKAAAFTRERLEKAESIWVESDNSQWNLDSTSERHLVWVWYRLPGESAYRNLNLEILQNGLSIANSTQQNRYGTICMNALNQARAQKLNLYSGQKDPDFYYGDAVELTLKELRTNLEAYNGIKVAFNGVVTINDANSVYVESYDEETGLYYGMSVYYGFGLSGTGLNILSVGNEVRIVGTVQYYEAGGTWQVSGLTYRMMKPKDPGNIQKLSEGHSPAYVLTSADTFVSQVTIQGEEIAQTFDYGQLALATSIEMQDLTVTEVYTTTDEDSSSRGALTLTCQSGEHTVIVRTIPLYGADGILITADMFTGKTISVKGIVDFYEGQYQIKVFGLDSISLND
ncbi:MAG: thermonuclease family protein [Clostridia bacterium]|nr:thermonuclease family protein [Clostridia bacterium]